MTGNTSYGAQRGAQNANCRTLSPLINGGDITALEARVAVLEAEVAALQGGSSASDETLQAWASATAYRMQVALENVSGVITSAVLLWPDGSAGTYNVQAINTTWNTADGWVLTHADSGKTITQPTITRSAISGIPLVTPDLIFS